MERRIYNKHIFLATLIVWLTQLLIVALLFAILLNVPKVNARNIEVEEPSTPAVEVEEYKEVETETKTQVQFTNYYPNDPYKSTTKTGSGLSTKDFTINEKGWYEYNGKLVIATSTYQCLASDFGGCATVNTMEDVPSDYKVYNYFDELEIEIDGVRYEGIVLDSCLASYWEREYQTFDIFIAGKQHAFGKVGGYIVE